MIGRALDGIYKAIGNEFTYALDDVRQKVVEEAWRGHPATPSPLSYEQWSGIGSVEPKGDALGRTVEQPKRTIGSDEPSAGLPDPLAEDRLSNLPEREAMATAYARHAEAGPHGLIEIENAVSHQQRSYEQWAGLSNLCEMEEEKLDWAHDEPEL